MKKLFYFFALFLLCGAFVSCGGDDKDEPENPNQPISSSLETKYGKATYTGIQYVSLFASAKDGQSELKIPGFPVIRVRMTSNYYPELYSETDEVEFFSGYDNRWSNSPHTDGWMRMPTLKSTPSKPEYVYAYIDKFETLTSPEHYRYGGRYKYESPLNFKGTGEKPEGWE